MVNAKRKWTGEDVADLVLDVLLALAVLGAARAGTLAMRRAAELEVALTLSHEITESTHNQLTAVREKLTRAEARLLELEPKAEA